ncbi:MAG: DUF5916 domain-containing protein [bacterium]
MQSYNSSSKRQNNESPNQFNRNLNGLTLLVCSFLLSSCLFSQTKEVFISRTDSPPKIDGELDDAVWQTCEKNAGFIQFDPYNGQPATENTSVMITYDADNLYVAFKCDDREPSKIAAYLTPREQFDANDYVTLILDTFDDQRTSYSFIINPKGVQKDEPGDYLWVSAALITSEGWQAEMKIPFKSIRFPKDDIQTWGINFERYIFRLQETDYFTRVGRDDVFLEKTAQLIGLNQIRGGKNLEFFPYGGFRSSRSGDESEQKFAGGLDARYALTSDLNLDLTMSPDFSEVESDPFFYQLSPYEYQLQEKRPFFQEGSRYFPGEHWGPSLFYSKRIDNPRVAGKISGRQGKYTIAAVGAINKEEIEDGTIGAFSLQRDVFKFSKVATMFSGYSNRDFRNFNGKFNFDLKFSEIFSWDGSVQFAHNSDTPDSQNKFYKTSIHYDPDEGWNGSLMFERIEKHFEPRAGIWEETDRQSLFFHPGYSFRLNKKGIKQIEFEWFVDIVQTADGKPLGYDIRPLELKLSTLKNHFVNLDINLGRTKVQLRQDGSLYWHDRYFQEREFELRASYEGNRFYQFSSSFEFSETPVYNSDFTEAYDGRGLEGEFSLSLRPTSTIKLSIGTEYTKQSKKEDGSTLFEGALSTMGFNWQITRYVFFSTVLQHDSYADRMKIDALLGIELGMGKTLSISYKSRGAMPLRKAIVGDEASTLLMKASYLFRI